MVSYKKNPKILKSIWKVNEIFIQDDVPGFINPNANLNNNNKSPTSFRFSQAKPKDDNPSLQPWFYNTGNPPKDSEVIRKEGFRMITNRSFKRCCIT
jgi:hypothetical protein